jgi:hypothetical protein
MQEILDLVWQHLLPAVHDEALPDNRAAAARLGRQLTSLSLPTPTGGMSVGNGVDRRFRLEPNSLGAEFVSFRFRDHSSSFTLESAQGTAQIECAGGRWVDGITNMPGTPPKFLAVADPRPVKVAAAGAWKDGKTFQMQWRFYETPHFDTVTCRFEGDELRIEFMNDVIESFNGDASVLRGRLMA